MATMNPFDLLGDDAEDPSHQIAAAEQLKLKVVAAAAATANAPTKPLTQPNKPSQPVREARNETSHGGRGAVRGGGYGRGGRGFNRDPLNDENTVPAGQGAFDGESGRPSERLSYRGPRGPYRGGRGGGGGGFSNGDSAEDRRPRRIFERRSGTGRGNDLKREGAGRGNWGTETDELAPTSEEVNETAKNVGDEKPSGEENIVADENKENPATKIEEKEPEDKEMTLEEYEKVLEEKRKALQALKTEERKVDTKVFESMQQLSNKKDNEEIFVKLGSDKDKRKEALEKEEKSRKSVSINEFLKPAEGESYYDPSRHGRGRGRGARGGYGGYEASNISAPSIKDPGHFPTLCGK